MKKENKKQPIDKSLPIVKLEWLSPGITRRHIVKALHDVHILNGVNGVHFIMKELIGSSCSAYIPSCSAYIQLKSNEDLKKIQRYNQQIVNDIYFNSKRASFIFCGSIN